VNETVRIVNCPRCGAPVPWKAESRYRPFCSARCKQIDLGAWASEEYRVPTSPPDASDHAGTEPTAGPQD
jgi:uncharacterized protein